MSSDFNFDFKLKSQHNCKQRSRNSLSKSQRLLKIATASQNSNGLSKSQQLLKITTTSNKMQIITTIDKTNSIMTLIFILNKNYNTAASNAAATASQNRNSTCPLTLILILNKNYNTVASDAAATASQNRNSTCPL